MAGSRPGTGAGPVAKELRKLGTLTRKNVLRRFRLVWPPVGMVRFGGLRRLTPVSALRGSDRGTPIDRYYIEDFISRHAGHDEYVIGDITGHVLEVGDDTYSAVFGSGVTKLDILHGDASNSRATIVADLAHADGLAADTFDCVICTQTLLLIYDFRAALGHLHRILKPGGVLLVTVPGISQICFPDADAGGDYWRFTSLSMRRLMEEFFDPANVTVEAYGNVLSSIAFLEGVSAEELKRSELDVRDPGYELIVAVRARR